MNKGFILVRNHINFIPVMRDNFTEVVIFVFKGFTNN